MRAALAWLPPLAIGLLCLGLPRAQQIRLLQGILLIALASAVLGLAQLAGGPDSPLRWHAVTNGVLPLYYPVNEQQSANIIDDVERQVIDFSMRKSAEIEELKKLEQYRRDFLGNVSHELKTPIFNTQGYIETLLDGGLDDPKINKDYLEKATKNLDRLASIVEDLLQISQYESGKLVLDIERFDIHQLTQDIFDALSYQAKSKQITLSFKGESNTPFFVEADKVRISQVLNNLISNAINQIKYAKNIH